MGYKKFIKSGNQLEYYEYQREPLARGRPKGYKREIKTEGIREGVVDSGGSAFQQKLERRRDNAWHASLAFRRTVLSNLDTSENPLLLTFTVKENITALSECARFFNICLVRMRRAYGGEFRYIAVPEFQKRGAVHYHALFWGLPAGELLEECKTGFISGVNPVLTELLGEKEVFVRNVSPTITEMFEQGMVFMKKTDGNERLAGYLSKYMVKAIKDERLYGHKAYFASRNIKRPIVVKGELAYWWSGDFDLKNIEPKKVKEYDTPWLGKVLYRLFTLKN